MAKEKVQQANFEEAIKLLEKEYGKGTVMTFGEKAKDEYDVISTGSLGFDLATGIGGFALGKMYELMGWEGTGKSTICGHATANAQKKFPNKHVLYIDGEHALDKKYFKMLGVDVDSMYLAQPTTGEEGFNIAEKLIRTGEISLCIIDSDTSLKPKSEIEGEAGDNAIGKKARLNSQMYPKLHTLAAKNGTCVIVISQYREKIGVMFGNPTTTSGGHALKFYSDGRIEVGKSLLKDGDDVYGSKTKIKFVKNKMYPPYKPAEFEIVFGKGIDRLTETIEMGNDLELFKKWGTKVKFEDGTSYEIDEFKQMLIDNPEFKEETENKIKEKYYAQG